MFAFSNNSLFYEKQTRRDSVKDSTMTIEIEKSSRHQKIIGDLGENIICNWLSRSGFEVAIVNRGTKTLVRVCLLNVFMIF